MKKLPKINRISRLSKNEKGPRAEDNRWMFRGLEDVDDSRFPPAPEKLVALKTLQK